MRYLPKNVTGLHHPTLGTGYAVTLDDGTREFWLMAWQAVARAGGWRPPKGSSVVMLRRPGVDSTRADAT